MTNTARVSGLLFDDNNVNGQFDGADDVVTKEVPVQLLDADGNVILSTRTDSTGRYEFNNLAAGSYKVKFLSGPFVRYSPKDVGNDATDSDVDQTGTTDVFDLDVGQNLEGVNAGCFKTALIGDKVFEDTNQNGIQDDGEAGVEDVVVRLLDSNGTLVDTTATSSSGEYRFTNLLPGDYKVVFVKPNNFDGFSPQNQGDDDSVDSDPNSNGETEVINISVGEDNRTVDAGLIKNPPPAKASLGDKVFEDLDRDGIQDGDEPGVSDVVVRLINSNGDVIRTTATDENGEYLFTNLEGGDYQVRFNRPGSFDGFTTQNAGDDDGIDSDADPSNGLTETVTLAPGDDNRTVDAGLVKDEPPNPATIGDKVFEDLDQDGIQDPDEPGVPNVIVRLENPEGQVVRTVVTDDNGEYSFTDISAGSYKVTFVRPGNFDRFSPQDQGDDDIDSDPAPDGMTEFFEVAPGENKDDVDAGLIKDVPPPKATLGDKVFEDLDRDGIQDGDEPGVSDVVVRLIDSNGDVIRTTATDENGEYLFTNLEGGDYQVRFSRPGSFDGFTTPNAGDDDGIDSDANPDTGLTETVTLAPGDDNRTVDAGLVKDEPPNPATIGDKVFNDLDEDGIQDPEEPGVPNVTVRLENPDGNVVETTTTDGNGEYTFDNVDPGTYKVTFVEPEGFDGFSPQNQGTDDALDSDPAPDGMTEFFEVAPGENKDDVDAGLIEDVPPNPATIGDKVFNDLDEDGIQDPDEPGVPNVTVRLENPDGNVVETTTTDGNGEYTFDNVDPGTYKVTFVEPDGFDGFSPQNQGTDDALDSDPAPDGMTEFFEVAPGENKDDVDAGLIEDAPPQTATLGDRVFNDQDRDGIQDQGEPGVPNVVVRLEDDQGNEVATDITNAQGNYLFENLAPDDYRIIVERPDNFDSFSPQDQGTDDAVDSDVNNSGVSNFVTLDAGDDNRTVDAGLIEDVPPQTASVGDKVFNDLDRDGIQDSDEPGVANVTVRLENPDGQTVDTTTTDGDGEYTFTDVDPGTYKVTFVEPNQGFDGFSPQNQGGNDAIDSDPAPDGMTEFFTVDPGENKDDVDAGLLPEQPGATLGDKVFDDQDSDGIQDPDEPGVSGVTVTLLDENGNSLGTDVTDDQGNYLFENLDAGDYQIGVETPGDFDGFSPQNQGTDDTVDSDVNPGNGVSGVVSLAPGEDNRTVDAGLVKDAPPEPATIGDFVFEDLDRDGIQDPDEPGVPNVTVRLENPDGQTVDTTTTDGDGEYTFTDVDPGTYKVTFVQPDGFDGFSPQDQGGNDDLDSDPAPDGMTEFFTVDPGENKDDVDAGLVEDAPPETATLGDLIFDDQDSDGIQDPDEPGVPNVVVRLENPDGEVLETEVTDSNGNYLFDNLAPGQYKITVLTPNGFDGFSPQDQGTDDAVDSDIDPTNGMSDFVTLAPGEDNRTLDGGLTKDIPPENAVLGDFVFDDQDRDGIQDPDEPGVPNTVVRLLDADGNVVDTEVTDDQGNYSFEVTPGTYSIRVQTPNGFDGFSPQNQGEDDTVDSDINPTNSTSGSVTLAPGEVNNSVDAGLTRPVQGATVGDFVFNDLDGDGIQDDDEPGIAGARVLLQDPDSNTLEETVTNADGIYSFNDLAPGDYKVTFEQPDGFDSVSPFSAGSNTSIDSDANPDNGLMSDVFTLSEGEVNNTIDAGFFGQAPDVNPDVEIEKTVRVEAVGTDPGINLCNEFGDPVGLIFEYVGGGAVNQTGQASATVTGPSISDPTVEILSTIPGDPVVIIPGIGKGKGKSKAGKAGKGKAGKGKGGIVNPGPINPDPDPIPDGTPVSLGQTFVIRPGADTANIQVEGAAGTQEITYVADCDEPIQLGDTIGGLRLVGFEGTTGSTRLAGNSSGDLDADDAPGPDALVGDNIVFNYVVRNTGDTPLGDIQVSDNILNPTFVGGDDNSNSLLDLDEEWTYTASETAIEGLRTNIGTINGIAVDVDGDPILVDDGSGGTQNIPVSADDPANYTATGSLNPIEIPNTEITPPTPPIQGDLCDTLGKPNSLVFLYKPSNVVNTAQEKFDIEGSADDDNIAFIVGGGKGKGGKGKGGVTTGTGGQQVTAGETFTIPVDGSNTNISILDDSAGPTLQSIDYHTSCSDVIQLGDQIGSIIVVGFNGEDGSTVLTDEQIDDLFSA